MTTKSQTTKTSSNASPREGLFPDNMLKSMLMWHSELLRKVLRPTQEVSVSWLSVIQ